MCNDKNVAYKSNDIKNKINKQGYHNKKIIPLPIVLKPYLATEWFSENEISTYFIDNTVKVYEEIICLILVKNNKYLLFRNN